MMKTLLKLIALLVLVVAPSYAQVSSTAPQTFWRETDQTLPAGLWRIQLNGNTFVIQQNTASAGDFSTVNTAISIANGGAVTIPTLGITTLTTPLVIGGSAASSTLTLESTSGTGTTDAILFKTGSQSERMRITTGGLVGIGGTPTTGQLDVFGSGQLSGNFRSTSASGGYVQIYDTTNSTYRGLVGYGAAVFTGGAITDFGLDAHNVLKLSTGSTVALTIDTSQKIGIGKSPTAYVDILNGNGVTNILDIYNSGNVNVFKIVNASGNVLVPTGQALFADGAAGAPSIAFISNTGHGLSYYSASYFGWSIAGSRHGLFGSDGFTVGSDMAIGFRSAADPASGTLDTILARDSANVLALKNGTTTQEFRVYGTTTGPVYTTVRNDGTHTHIGAANSGGRLYLTDNGSDSWFIIGGVLAPTADNSINFGAVSSRIATGYFGTSLNVGLATNATGQLYIGSNGANNLSMDRASTDSTSSALIGYKSRGTQASRSDVANGDTVYQILADAYSGGFLDTSQILFKIDGTFTTGQRPPSRIEFYTNAANGAQTLQVDIKAAGGVHMFNLTGSAGLQTGVLCLSSGNEIINDSVACLASSRRFKNDLGLMDTDPLKLVMQMTPVRFTYKNEGWAKEKADWSEHFGFYAEDVAKIEPRLVNFEHDGITPRGVQYDMYTAVLTGAIQQQQREIEGLRGRIAVLEAK